MLEVTLPPPLYSFIASAISHAIAAATALTSLCSSLISTHPSEWNAHTLLPPIITILAAYLALSSLYRTATWVLRTSFWFAKWGIILAAFFAGVGYIMRASGDGFSLANNAPYCVGPSCTTDGLNTQRYSRSKIQNKPSIYDSFEKHREWQYQEQDRQAQPAAFDTQHLVSMLTNAAGYVVGSEWWNMGQVSTTDTRKAKDGKSKVHAAKSRSR